MGDVDGFQEVASAIHAQTGTRRLRNFARPQLPIYRAEGAAATPFGLYS